MKKIKPLELEEIIQRMLKLLEGWGFIVLGDKLNKHDFSYNNLILLEAITSQIVPAIQHINLEALESAQSELKKVYIDY